MLCCIAMQTAIHVTSMCKLRKSTNSLKKLDSNEPKCIRISPNFRALVFTLNGKFYILRVVARKVVVDTSFKIAPIFLRHW